MTLQVVSGRNGYPVDYKNRIEAWLVGTDELGVSRKEAKGQRSKSDFPFASLLLGALCVKTSLRTFNPKYWLIAES